MNLTDAFLQQAESCTRMGSPFMGRLLSVLAEIWNPNTALGQVMASYEGDLGPAGHSLPLRIAGGLHALVLSGQSQELSDVYPPHNSSNALLLKSVRKALIENEDFLLHWTKLPPQTNEVRRSAALIAMAHVALEHFDRPIVLSELGASGGLNLSWDAFRIETKEFMRGCSSSTLILRPDWTGPPPPENSPVIAERSGVDLNPLNPKNEADFLRLMAYLWPDQPERLENTRRAANLTRAVIQKDDAIEWLEDRISTKRAGHLHLIQHTVAWQYFPDEAQAKGTALIEAAGSQATAETPLGWMQMETDGDTTGAVGAALTLRLWPGNITLNLGRADFHGRWIKWTGP